jgi:AraC family transcriptional regulator
MEPEIIEYPAMLVAGTLYEGDNKKQEISSLWANAFNPNSDKIKNADPTRAYGVCEMDDRLPEGSFRYVAAFQITRPEDAPPEFYQMHVPGGKYAVFKHAGALDGLPKTFDYIYNVWLPKSGYRRANRPDLEVYTNEFRDFAPDSVMYLYIPID